MKEIINNLNINLSTSFSFNEKGIIAYQYYDILKNQDDCGQEIKIDYQDLEDSFFESYVIHKNEKECLKHEYEDTLELANDICGLLKFAESVKKRFEQGVKNYETEFKNGVKNEI
jgi:hypothetical protein